MTVEGSAPGVDDSEILQVVRRHEALMRNANEVVAVVAADGQVTYVSPAAQRVFGYTEAEMAGAMGYEFIHPDDRGEAAAAMLRCVEEGTSFCVLRARHADGSWRWIEETMVNCLDDPAIAGLVVNTRDVTERRLAEQRLVAAGRLRAVVSAINHAMLRATDPVAYLDEVCAIAVEHGGFRAAWAGEVDAERGLVRPVARRHDRRAGAVDVECEVALDGNPAFAEAVRTGEPVISDDLRDDPGVASSREPPLGEGARSEALFPLCVERRVVAILVLYSDSLDYWDGEQRRLSTQLAEDVSYALESLEERRRRREAEREAAVRTAQQSAVASLGMLALETCDRDDFLRAAMDAVMETLDVTHASIFEVTPDPEYLRVRASRPEGEDLRAGDLMHRAMLSLTGYVIDTGESVTVDDRREDPRFPWSYLAKRLGYLAAMGSPIVANGRCYGAFTVHHVQPRAFSPDDQHFLASVAHLVAWVYERADYEDEMRYRSLHDAATGLPNRELFKDRLAQAVARARRRRTRAAAVLSIDLDRFKVINDSMGHENGDAVLVAVARRLERCVRGGDTVARISGDQFTVLCEDLRRGEDATLLAEKIQDRLRQPLVVAQREIALSASIGVAVIGPATTPEQVLSEVDAAMHRAKQHGRGRWELVDDSMRDHALQRLELEEGLRHAAERGELRVHYQPVVDVAGGDTVGVEALVRWERPGCGLVAPASFIPLAEETGLIVPVGRWVLGEACRTVAGWNRRRGDLPPLEVAVNLSTRQLVDPDLVSSVAAALRDSGLPPGLLCLELTESFLMDTAHGGIAVLGALHQLGVRLSVDDFGTGYSSLLYLRSLPVDILKVDRTFVAGLGKNAEDTAIVQGVIALAHSLGLQVVAEGVEDAGQVDGLRALQCDLGQGFHWSPPLPEDEAAVLLGAGTAAMAAAGRGQLGGPLD